MRIYKTKWLANRAVFIYGFAKSERENIAEDELLSLREIAAGWIGADAEEMSRALEERIIEVVNDGEDQKT